MTCLACGYNLRGLDVRGNCPECGQPVAQSLRDGRLETMPPRVVMNWSRGALLHLTACVIALLFMFPWGMILIGDPIGSPETGICMTCGLAFLIVPCVAIGSWKLATISLEEPPHAASLRWALALRWLVRLAALSIIATVMFGLGPTSSGLVALLTRVAGPLVFVMLLFGMVGLSIYRAVVVAGNQRPKIPQMAQRLRRVGMWMGVALGSLFAMNAIFWATAPAPAPAVGGFAITPQMATSPYAGGVGSMATPAPTSGTSAPKPPVWRVAVHDVLLFANFAGLVAVFVFVVFLAAFWHEVYTELHDAGIEAETFHAARRIE